MNSTYLEQLEALLRSHANPVVAGPMQSYMKGHFPFLGIKTPERNMITNSFIKEHGIPHGDELDSIVRALWALPEREFHYTAMILLEKQRKKATKRQIELLEELICSKSWWDTVDLLAGHLVGNLFTLYPELISEYIKRWMESGHLWLQRTALLFQLGYKQQTDSHLLFDCIRRVADSKEFFIRKAIGWALREYSKTNEAAVRQFVAETALSSLSVREALRVVDKKK